MAAARVFSFDSPRQDTPARAIASAMPAFHPFSRLPYELRDQIWAEAAVLGPARPGMHFFRLFDTERHQQQLPHQQFCVSPSCKSRFMLAAPFAAGEWERIDNSSAYLAANVLSRTCAESREVVRRLRSRVTKYSVVADGATGPRGPAGETGVVSDAADQWASLGVELSATKRPNRTAAPEEDDYCPQQDEHPKRQGDESVNANKEGRRYLVHAENDVICLQFYDWGFAELRWYPSLFPWWGDGFGVPLLGRAERVALEYDAASWDWAFRDYDDDGCTPAGAGYTESLAPPEQIERSLQGPKWLPAHLRQLRCFYVIDYSIRQSPGTEASMETSNTIKNNTNDGRTQTSDCRDGPEVFYAIGKTFHEVRPSDNNWLVGSCVFAFAAWLKRQHHLTQVYSQSPQFKVLACVADCIFTSEISVNGYTETISS